MKPRTLMLLMMFSGALLVAADMYDSDVIAVGLEGEGIEVRIRDLE